MNIAKQHVELKQAFQKKDYNPSQVLLNTKFTSVRCDEFQAVEKYALYQLIALIKSMQFWSHIPSDIKPDLTTALEEHFKKKLCH